MSRSYICLFLSWSELWANYLTNLCTGVQERKKEREKRRKKEKFEVCGVVVCSIRVFCSSTSGPHGYCGDRWWNRVLILQQRTRTFQLEGRRDAWGYRNPNKSGWRNCRPSWWCPKSMELACVASVPVRAERNWKDRERVFAFRTRGKWGENKKRRGKNGARAKRAREGGGGGEEENPLLPHFPHVHSGENCFSRSFISFGSYGNACYAGNDGTSLLLYTYIKTLFSYAIKGTKTARMDVSKGRTDPRAK